MRIGSEEGHIRLYESPFHLLSWLKRNLLQRIGKGHKNS